MHSGSTGDGSIAAGGVTSGTRMGQQHEEGHLTDSSDPAVQYWEHGGDGYSTDVWLHLVHTCIRAIASKVQVVLAAQICC